MAKTSFRPLHDRVVVRRIEADEKTKGGIIIPDTAKEKPSEGEIIAVGVGWSREAARGAARQCRWSQSAPAQNSVRVLSA